MQKHIVWFREVSKEDIPLVGGKGANLGEMAGIGLPVPPGFIVTAGTYFDFLDSANLRPKIKAVLDGIDVDDSTLLQTVASRAKDLITNTPIPEEIEASIKNAYGRLRQRAGSLVAVRSSATAEDLPDASFAGQQATFLNISGEDNVVKAVRDAWASLFEPRAIFYRVQKKFNHFKVGIAVPVQAMVQSVVSGVMFTVDPINGDKHMVVIEAVWGLGEMIVQGQVTPDHYDIDKVSFTIKKKEYVEQEVQLIRKGSVTKEQPVPEKRRDDPKLTDEQILDLAKIGVKIEKHYYFPQDIEWAWDGHQFFIVQTRPITTLGGEKQNQKKEVTHGAVILKGSPASPGMVTGSTRIIHSAHELHRVKHGDVLVTEMTNPDFVPAMRRAVAVVTDKGGRTSHAAIVSRELGIPAVVGTEQATKVLKNDAFITVDGSEGVVYDGGRRSKQTASAATMPTVSIQKRVEYMDKTATKVYVNLAEPERAVEVSQMNVDGVGLLRAEFMIAEMGVHPKKLLHEQKGAWFTAELARRLEIFVAAFHPRPVVYRATDFKTNEYRNLKGGEQYEPVEPNPMLGYRGCYRYIHDPSVFRLEINAIKRVREKYDNLWLMIPFIRTVKELCEVKKLLSSFGLRRSPTFKLWMMVEIPSNVILLDKFLATGIDGVSIGSNDLTMLILGTDRDNSEVAPEFDERNEAVLWALQKIIRTCVQQKVTVSICGQAPSTYPDFATKLVEWGITSISVTADALDSVRSIIRTSEERLVRRSR
ncbi:MAG: phosphoenolpyruvate synthase [bacterium]|nr:phosphoenolpyruvate synthase [bacterium]